jgi:hypothetical protein
MTPVEARLDTHEQVCEFRYDSINARLKRIEQILIGSCRHHWNAVNACFKALGT